MIYTVSMIARLRGTVVTKDISNVVIDVGGIGYGVMVTTEDHGRLILDCDVILHIYEHVRETSFDLYGFIDVSTKQLFEVLINVNGVGPKMALSVMSIGSGDEVRRAIATGDTKYIQAAPGVGKRVAERIIVDLKDKVGLASSDDALSFLSIPTTVGDEAAQALMSLGYSAQDAQTKLQGIDASLSVEQRIKLALKR